MTRVELLKVLVEDYNEDISTIKSLTKEELEELLEEYIDEDLFQLDTNENEDFRLNFVRFFTKFFDSMYIKEGKIIMLERFLVKNYLAS